MAHASNNGIDGPSVLGPTVRFKGKLHADEDLQIHGQVDGSITHTKYLTVSTDGHVKGEISGHIIVVDGTVEGDLVATTSVAVTESGHLNGDIRSPSISINDGADFNGRVAMTGARAGKGHPEPRTQQPVVAETAAATKG